MKAIGMLIRTLLILTIIVVGAAIAYAYSGHYDLSVGSGHMPWTQWYLDTLRHRSIESRAADIDVPDLEGEDMFEAGAVAYNDNCSGCHGRPGRGPSDSWEPSPPALTRFQPDPAELFWVVRNGIKMSAMPRIGENRVSDEAVWQIAAFLQSASRLTEGEYRELVEPPEAEAEAETSGKEQDSEAEPTEGEQATEAEATEGAEAADVNGEADNGDSGGEE